MKQILIVEDEPALREVYVMLFQMNSYGVHEAGNGEIALHQMKTAKPDIVILDALMPVMGGIEFLQNIKLKTNYSGTKVIMLSNLSDPKTIAAAEKLGVHKYLLKASVSPQELVGAVKELLAEK